jgi:hypothetical protein
MILLVEMPLLAHESPATEAIERANPLLDLGMLGEELDVGHVA